MILMCIVRQHMTTLTDKFLLCVNKHLIAKTNVTLTSSYWNLTVNLGTICQVFGIFTWEC